MACRWLATSAPPDIPAVIGFDSTYAGHIAEGIFTARANAVLARRVQQELASAREGRPVALQHVRAHTGVRGNVRANLNAARGAAGATAVWSELADHEPRDSPPAKRARPSDGRPPN